MARNKLMTEQHNRKKENHAKNQCNSELVHNKINKVDKYHYLEMIWLYVLGKWPQIFDEGTPISYKIFEENGQL